MPYHYFKTKNRLAQTLEKINQAIYTPISELEATAWLSTEPVTFDQKQSGEKRKIALGESWGQLWDCGWFHFTGEVPAIGKGYNVVLMIDLSGEGCVFDDDGCPVLGLTTRSVFYPSFLGPSDKRIVPITECAKGGESIDLWVDAANNGLFGRYKDNGILKEAHVAILHQEIFDLYHDFRILHNLMEQLPEDSARYHRILAALHHASHKLSTIITKDDAKRAREMLAPELAKVGGTPSLKISAIGHAHMDLAWLWPIRETIRKGARTFATALHNMERYPDYVFGASQGQYYQWMKDHYPPLYQKIKAKVAEGRLEAQGALWVEPDTNTPSGESLVRQILYGKQFFREEFGIEPRTCWLPDVFGYTGALPQILKKSGVDYFMTQKLSWNIFNSFPHHTFMWEGIDGSRVLTHMLPEENYNSPANSGSLVKAERNFADKVVSEECLLLFGIGDGGGGPGELQLEALKRQKNLAGLPPVTQEPAEAFFDRIVKDSSRYKVWAGELYMERHQGTYTTQGRNKWFNRKIEIALRELELWTALSGYSYPREELDVIWKEVLLYQFHDILPGSSITRVYDESLPRYAELLNQVNKLIADTDLALSNQVALSEYQRPSIIKNSLSWERDEWVKIDDIWLRATVPPIGYTTVDLANVDVELPQLNATETKLENEILSVQFNENGAIDTVYDKEYSHEVLAGEGNKLAVWVDNGDAWDIEYDYRDKPPAYFELISSTASVDGPQAILHQEYKFGDSTLDQHIVLTAGSRRIDFITEVDWRENNKMLRTSFPVAVHTRDVTCDIQFGSIRRPTHQNTSWDMAQHEICAHKWIDLSQPDYGVALLKDSKYGHYVKENLLDLNLLRSPNYPDPVADRAIHQFTYALYPHFGDHRMGQVARAGYELNMPLQIVFPTSSGELLSSQHKFMELDSESIVVETVKIAEDSDDLIVRLYESSGINVQTKLRFGLNIKTVLITDLMEITTYELPVVDKQVELTFKPFEIITLRVNK